jgi:hypothetical protein
VFGTLRPRPLAELPHVLHAHGEVRVLASLVSNLFFLAAKACLFGIDALLADLLAFSRQMESRGNPAGSEHALVLTRDLAQWLMIAQSQEEQDLAGTTGAGDVSQSLDSLASPNASEPASPERRPASPPGPAPVALSGGTTTGTGPPGLPERPNSPGRAGSPSRPTSPGRPVRSPHRATDLVPKWLAMLHNDRDRLSQPLQVLLLCVCSVCV